MNKRDPYFDNAKYLLIFLVVFGHLLTSIKTNHSFFYTLYETIYLFHMPAFILISGYFAKGYRKHGYYKKMAKTLLAPYVFFQLVYSFVYYFTGKHEQLTFTWLDPYWTLWFLLSLFCWNLLLPIFARSKYMIIVALAIGIGAGCFNQVGSLLSLSRTLVFFPFFLIGYYTSKQLFVHLQTAPAKVLSTVLFIGTAVTCYYVMDSGATDWLLGSLSYDRLGVSGLIGSFVRLLWYAAAMTIVAGFFALVPSNEHWFTSLGGKSIYIYLLHGFLVKLITAAPAFRSINEPVQIIGTLLIALLITILLGSKPVTRITQPVIQLESHNPFRKVF